MKIGRIGSKIGSHEITNTKREKLSGVRLDSVCNLIIIYHLQKANRKACVLVRVTSFMNLSKKCTLLNAFFKRQKLLSTYLDVP